MATYTPNHNLKKPAPEDFYNVEDQNSNMDKIDEALASMVPNTQKGAAGGVAELGSDGKVPEAQLPPMNFDSSGSAAYVQTNLNAHTNNKNNPHGTTAEQVGAFAKEQSISAVVAGLYGKGATATPNDIFAAIKPLITDAKNEALSRRPVYGSYTGTRGSGSEIQQINLGFSPLCVIVASRSEFGGVFSIAYNGAQNDSITFNSSGFTVTNNINSYPGGSQSKDWNPYRYIAFR